MSRKAKAKLSAELSPTEIFLQSLEANLAKLGEEEEPVGRKKAAKKRSTASKKKAVAKKAVEKKRDAKEKKVTVTWRLPSDLVAKCSEEGWDYLRDILDAWAEDKDRYQVEAEEQEETEVACFNIRKSTLDRLKSEAARVSKTSSRKWAPARIAREVMKEREKNQA